MMRYELTDFEWAAIVDPRVPHAVQRLLAVRRRAGTQPGREPINSDWSAEVRFGAHNGLKSEIAPRPFYAKCGRRCRA
jgi:hypothetical protein